MKMYVEREIRRAGVSSAPDFEFDFGKGRQLKGRGWRGLIALALLLNFLLLVVCVGTPGLADMRTLVNGILHQTFAPK
jgi:hypothetical protein